MARRYGQDDSAPPVPRNDVYTGLLAISFFAMLAGCLLLLLDWYSYPESRPKGVSISPVPGASVPAAKAPKGIKKEPKEEPKKEPKDDAKKEEMKKEDKKEEMKKEEMKKDEKKE